MRNLAKNKAGQRSFEHFPSIPETSFCTDGEFIVAVSSLTKKLAQPHELKQRSFLRLADELDRISPKIVHGNLSKKTSSSTEKALHNRLGTLPETRLKEESPYRTIPGY